ncbi:MAG: monofunctional biosynthetic peptidoglycan transglycosylase [Thermoanaerobaculia bacterium]
MIKRAILFLLVVAVAWLAWELITFPDVAILARERPKTTAFMEQRKEWLRDHGKSDELEWRWVSYGNISPSLRRAVLVAEDNSFYEHEGVDVEGMKEAFERDWKHRKITHGGSTITQQLAKNLYLSPSRNPLRKIREYFIARSLEKHLTKKRILEIYLNVVEMGERVYGAEAASRHYFGKSASALSASQAALLAGCLPNPRVMNPGNPNKRLRARQRMILSRMKRWGYMLEREVLTEKKPEPEKTTTATSETTETSDTAPVTDTDLAPQETETTETTATETATDTAPPPEPQPPPEAEPTPTTTTQ